MGKRRLMPHLRIETAPPTETEKAITTLEQENIELEEQIKRLENSMEQIYQKVFRDEIEQERREKWIEEQSIRLDERREILKEFQDLIKKAKEEKK